MSKPFFTTDPDASAGPITYQKMVDAYTRLQMQAPMMHTTIYGIDADTADDEHVSGRLCENNPFCEECYS